MGYESQYGAARNPGLSVISLQLEGCGLQLEASVCSFPAAGEPLDFER